MALNRDLKEFLLLLAKHEVKFMLVGAHAVAVHGYPRNTEDLDFWIQRSQENAIKVLAMLDEFGFGELGLTEQDLTDDNTVIQLGNEPNRIDLLTFLTGVDFDDCYQRKMDALFEGVPLAVISLEDLLKNKRQTARHKDLMDVEEFEKYLKKKNK